MSALRRLALVAIFVAGVAAGWSDLNEAGKAAYARGEYATAERLFRQATEMAPDESEVHYHHGVALTHLHRWAEAAAAYNKALALRPSATVAAAARQGLKTIEPMLRPRSSTSVSDPGPVTPPRPKAARVELPPDSVRIRRRGGNWVVDVVVNDMRSSTFLVDSGASACAITPELAEALGIVPDPDAPPVLVRGVAGSTWGRRVTIPSIRVGDMEARDVIAFVLPLPGLEGILGNTFLARYTATLDPVREVLTLQPR